MFSYALVHRNGQQQGSQIAIEKSKLVIGRSSDCDVHLATPDISRKHCVVIQTHNGVFVRDLSSRNGTRVNGNLIPSETAIELHHRDKLQCGRWKFRFLAESSGASEPSGASTPRSDRQANGVTSRPTGSSLADRPALPADLLSELDQIAASLNISIDNIAETQTAVSIDVPGSDPSNATQDVTAEDRSSASQSSASEDARKPTTEDKDITESLSAGGQSQDASESESDEEASDEAKSTSKPEPSRLPDHLRPKGPVDSQDAAERALRKMFGG